ncbi:MAG: MFS transporter [Methylophaga sp.]|uniref:MFS transporter n=1 Tax=Methylophaga sp. UBA678 TaxID=1946901 RepID=UPI000C353168|nr:MFS transporter [Methylophaga sp. UBA678]MAX53235.1 MFS transporter [Methylophaga sp.]|tara:strand:- start:100882 stop:102099 length:1218 start_codon:yes stop_codon:yes gene_type:complete
MDPENRLSYVGLLKNHFGLIAAAYLAVFTGNLGQSFFIGLFRTDISEYLNISAGEFGSIYAVITMISGFLVMHFGPKIDWIAPRRYVLSVLIVLTIGVLMLTLSPWWGLCVFGLGLQRLCGQGLMTHFGSTLAGREFSTNRGKALGLVTLGMPTGEIILPPIIAIMAVSFSWQQVWWSILAVLIGLWALLILFVDWPPAPRQKHEHKQHKDAGPSPTRDLRFWLLLPMLMVLPITLTGIFIYQAQMTKDLLASPTTYALALTGLGIARFPGALLGGRWIDEYGATTLAKLYLIPFALALLIAATVGGDMGIWILMLGAGTALGMSSPIGDTLLVRLWGRDHLGQVRSLKSAFLVFSTGIAPAFLGFMIDAGVTFQSILLGMLTFLIIAWILAQGPIKEAHQSSEI